MLILTRLRDWLNDKPTWFKATLWLTLSALIDGVYNAFTTGQISVNSVWLPFINVAIVAIRDFIRSQTEKSEVKP